MKERLIDSLKISLSGDHCLIGNHTSCQGGYVQLEKMMRQNMSLSSVKELLNLVASRYRISTWKEKECILLSSAKYRDSLSA
jgi:hypothetical protein